jgi:hypothetical protein
MDSGSAPAEIVDVGIGNYRASRLNALKHGVLSRHTLLPWEDADEYQALLAALVAEHAPEGPTEEHLVEELAGIIWRKRRVRMAEASIFRQELRHKAAVYNGPEHVVGAALMPFTGDPEARANVPCAIVATATQTARDLRELRRDQGIAQDALNILDADGPDAYGRALAALHGDMRDFWQDCLSDPPDDGLTYTATAEALMAWIRHHWREWFDDPLLELQYRDAIRDQAFGMAYATDELEVPARYEIHLDRKLERTLSMLIKLRDFRQPVPA